MFVARMIFFILINRVVDYLLKYRLQWGKPDALSLLHPLLENRPTPNDPAHSAVHAPDIHPYFTVDTPEELISIVRNDWPYSG